MTAGANVEIKRSWRGGPSGVLVRRSRHLWRVLLSALVVVLIGLAVLWAWPRPLPRTLLLVLTSDREERTLPLVPFSAGDSEALLAWARAAKVPASHQQLSEIANSRDLVRRLGPEASAENRFSFMLEGTGRPSRFAATDALVIYIKGHGLAVDVGDSKPDVRPLIITSLSETDLAGPWFRDESHVIDVSALLGELARLPEQRKLVVFDAVHLNYDPRLGSLVNAFPQAVQKAVEQLPARSNLWVLLGQGDGELAVGLPGTGRSALVDSLVKALERGPREPNSIDIDKVVTKAQSRLSELGQTGRGTFKQSLQKVFTAASGQTAAPFTLPTSAPPADGSKKSPDVAKTAAATAAQVARDIPGGSEVTEVVTGVKQVQTAAGQVTGGTPKTPETKP